MSFGHGNTRGHIAYCLESATIAIDLRNHLLTVTPGKGPQSLPHRAASSLKMSWDIGKGAAGTVFARATGRTSKDPGIEGLLQNYYKVIDNGGDLIVSEKTASRTIQLMERLWEVVQPE